jgi:TctA family transporter
MLETALRRSLILSDGSFRIFLTRPISAAFFLLTLAALAAPLLVRARFGFGLARED